MAKDELAQFGYEFGPFRLEVAERLLLRDGEPVLLPPKAFDTLLVLVANCGRILKKDDLLKAVWPETIVEENNLSQYVSTLRKALGDAPNGNKYIETVPKLGYRFVAHVIEYRAGEKTGAQERGRSDGFPAESIAVLPFKYLGAEESDEYLGLGLADAIITRLGNLSQIVVRPTSSVRKYAGLIQDPVAAGRDLRVVAVLEGSIQRDGDRIRVTVQLVNVADEAPLWAEKFEVEFRDLFTVEDSISEQVAAALILKLSSEERQRLTKHYTENIAAYRLYLKGRYYWNKRAGEGMKKAIWHFQQAIETDPGYALALAGLADCYNLASYYSELPPKESFSRAKAAAIKALEIDDQLAEAHASLAFARAWHDWDFPGAESAFQRALELNPNYATGRHWYALYLMVMGRTAEAGAEVRRAQELDPLSLAINRDVGWVYHLGARQYDQAIEQYLNTLELDPGFWPTRWLLGMAYEQKEMRVEAIAELKQALALSGGRTRMLADSASVEQTRILAELGHAYAASGQGSEAAQVLGELLELSQRQYVSPYEFALIHLGLGEMDEAFDCLRQAYLEHSDRLIYLKVDPRLDGLRSDRRFTNLLQLVGLTPYPGPSLY